MYLRMVSAHTEKGEKMADYISRGKAIEAIMDLPNCPNGYSDTYDKECIIGTLEEVPTANVRENVHAHWEEADKYGNRRCSNCETVEHVPTLMGKPIVWNFCPNCGAKMCERRDDVEVTKRTD